MGQKLTMTFTVYGLIWQCLYIYLFVHVRANNEIKSLSPPFVSRTDGDDDHTNERRQRFMYISMFAIADRKPTIHDVLFDK